MSRVRCMTVVALTVIACLWAAGVAFAQTTTVTRADGYTVTLTGPATGKVGQASAFTATCGYPGFVGACPYGEFRMFGAGVNRLGEGFGRGASGSYVFRTAGAYSIRYRVPAGCVGSPRLACPIDVWLSTTVGA